MICTFKTYTKEQYFNQLAVTACTEHYHLKSFECRLLSLGLFHFLVDRPKYKRINSHSDAFNFNIFFRFNKVTNKYLPWLPKKLKTSPIILILIIIGHWFKHYSWFHIWYYKLFVKGLFRNSTVMFHTLHCVYHPFHYCFHVFVYSIEIYFPVNNRQYNDFFLTRKWGSWGKSLNSSTIVLSSGW